MRVKRPATRWRQRLQRIKAGEYHLAEGIITAGQNLVSLSTPNHFPCLTDGAGSGGTGIGDDRNRPGKTKGVQHHPRLEVRLIMQNPCWLSFVVMGQTDGLA